MGIATGHGEVQLSHVDPGAFGWKGDAQVLVYAEVGGVGSGGGRAG